MRGVKYELNSYSFYDRTGIERHLEKMAARGWLIERLGSIWRYRRAEPKKLRFSVVYYPDSSEFAPEQPSEGELTFWDYCAQAGWVRAAHRGQMSVFYSGDERAVPIDTDAALQVETLHETMKREQITSYLIISGIALWQLVRVWRGFASDLTASLAVPSELFGLCDWLLLMLLSLGELGGYYLWRRRAKRAAEAGQFLPTRSHPGLQRAILALVLLGFGVTIFDSSRTERPMLLVGLAGVLLVYAAVQGTKAVLKRRGAGTGKNKAVTYAVSFALSFALMFGILRAERAGVLRPEPENATPYVVEYSGGDTAQYYAYHDALPLSVQDLKKTDYDRYSCELSESASALAAQTVGKQSMREGDGESNALELSYRVTDVRFAPLFSLCLRSELSYFQNYTITFYRTHHPFRNLVFRETDAAPWGAERAWRLYNKKDGDWNDTWLLTRGTRIVRVSGTALSGLGEAQMALIGERLLSI